MDAQGGRGKAHAHLLVQLFLLLRRISNVESGLPMNQKLSIFELLLDEFAVLEWQHQLAP